MFLLEKQNKLSPSKCKQSFPFHFRTDYLFKLLFTPLIFITCLEQSDGVFLRHFNQHEVRDFNRHRDPLQHADDGFRSLRDECRMGVRSVLSQYHVHHYLHTRGHCESDWAETTVLPLRVEHI